MPSRPEDQMEESSRDFEEDAKRMQKRLPLLPIGKKLQTSDELVRDKIRDKAYQKNVANIHQELDEEEQELKSYFEKLEEPTQQDPTLVS